MKQKAIFLDRDGTIIYDKNYLADPKEVELLPGVVEGIRRLQAANYLIVVVTNQSGVARGLFDETTVHQVHARLQALLQAQGAKLDAIYYCPHYPQGTVAAYTRLCDCRKPAPGMLLQAAKELNIDLSQSWILGDKSADITLGRSQGMHTALVLTGYGSTTWQEGFPPASQPDLVVADLAAAAKKILAFSPDPTKDHSAPREE